MSARLAVGNGKNQEAEYSKNDEEKAEQQASDEQIRKPLLFGSGMGDAEGGDEGFSQPGEEFQWSVCLRLAYVICGGRVNCFGTIR